MRFKWWSFVWPGFGLERIFYLVNGGELELAVCGIRVGFQICAAAFLSLGMAALDNEL